MDSLRDTAFYLMVWQSFQRDGLSLFHYRRLFSTPLYVSAMATTFQISLSVTAGCLLLGYPVAYLIATAGPRVRSLVLLLVGLVGLGGVVAWRRRAS